MSTDFSLDALLNGSTSSTSVTSPQSSKPSPLPLPPSTSSASCSTSPTAAQLISVFKTLPTPPSTDEEQTGDDKKRRNKRKREDDDDEQQKCEQKEEAPQPKKKRVRTAYTKQQLLRLEFMFAQDPYPDMLMRENIAEELGLPDQKIHVRILAMHTLQYYGTLRWGMREMMSELTCIFLSPIIQVWFQNRRAKQRRLRGQPTAVLPTPVVFQCQPSPSFPFHPQNTQQSIGVQTQSRLAVPSPSPSPTPVPPTVTGRKSASSTPSVSPQQSSTSGSPAQPSPLGNIAYPPPPPSYGFVLPPRTPSPSTIGHFPPANFASPFPYYYPQGNCSMSQPPMYFMYGNVSPPLSGRRVNSVVPSFPLFHH